MKWTLATLFFLTGCISSDTRIGLIKNQFGRNVGWEKFPITLHVHKDFPEEYYQDVRDSVDVWNKDKHRIDVVFDKTDTTPGKDRTNVLYWSTKWHGSRDEQARTTVYFIISEITESDIYMNAEDYVYYTGIPQTCRREVSLKSVLIHELGHFVGLGHRNGEYNVMYPYLSYCYDRLNLTSEDEWVLKQL